jgi:hypothetical protein
MRYCHIKEMINKKEYPTIKTAKHLNNTTKSNISTYITND